MPTRLRETSPDFQARFQALLGARADAADAVEAAARTIVADVRARGDEAVLEHTRRLDRLAADSAADLLISDDDVAAAAGSCAPDALDALRFAADRIRAFHEKTAPADQEWIDSAGVRLGTRWRPVRAAGLYAPGGTAAYPSSVLMNAIPARVAGVERLVMTSPTPNRRLNPLVAAAARLAGVDAFYRIGGAQAIAALAYGTASIPAVDVITGPGNAWVAAAKRQVFGQVGIDMIAGPSEILVVADADNPPEWIACDLLSQAEHDPAAQAILITDSADFAGAVERAAVALLAELPRRDIAGASWRDHGAVIVVDSLDSAPALIDALAPEHLELAVAAPDALAARVRNAGAIFLGRHTPEAIGDYVAGPNHVLPTSRTARFASGLGVADFMKRTTVVGCDAGSLKAIGPAAVTLAAAEGLDAHARSVAQRL